MWCEVDLLSIHIDLFLMKLDLTPPVHLPNDVRDGVAAEGWDSVTASVLSQNTIILSFKCVTMTGPLRGTSSPSMQSLFSTPGPASVSSVLTGGWRL